MKRSLSGRLIAGSLVVILMAATMNVYAEQPGHAAFVRGGEAIAAALNQRTPASEPLLTAKLIPHADQPALPTPAPKAQAGKQRKAMILIGIGITGVIAGYLIHRSYVNHGHIFSGT